MTKLLSFLTKFINSPIIITIVTLFFVNFVGQSLLDRQKKISEDAERRHALILLSVEIYKRMQSLTLLDSKYGEPNWCEVGVEEQNVVSGNSKYIPTEKIYDGEDTASLLSDIEFYMGRPVDWLGWLYTVSSVSTTRAGLALYVHIAVQKYHKTPLFFDIVAHEYGYREFGQDMDKYDKDYHRLNNKYGQDEGSLLYEEAREKVMLANKSVSGTKRTEPRDSELIRCGSEARVVY